MNDDDTYSLGAHLPLLNEYLKKGRIGILREETNYLKLCKEMDSTIYL
jgi:hypothetical protein